MRSESACCFHRLLPTSGWLIHPAKWTTHLGVNRTLHATNQFVNPAIDTTLRLSIESTACLATVSRDIVIHLGKQHRFIIASNLSEFRLSRPGQCVVTDTLSSCNSTDKASEMQYKSFRCIIDSHKGARLKTCCRCNVQDVTFGLRFQEVSTGGSIDERHNVQFFCRISLSIANPSNFPVDPNPALINADRWSWSVTLYQLSVVFDPLDHTDTLLHLYCIQCSVLLHV